MEDFVGVRQLIATVLRARLPKKPQDSLWDIYIDPEGCISKITEHDPTRPEATTIIPGIIDAAGRLVGPSLCHAHIHLDKCFLLQDDKYRDLKIIKGDFDEAISLTNQAKQRFEEDDLIRRGCRLITESNQSRVTSMRAFVEVDENVGMRCLGVALKLKEKFQSECYVQICAFAQLALFSGEDTCRHRRALLETAAESSDVEVISSTPYVENSSEMMQKNCLWTIEVAIAYGKHLDFHLDYNVDDQIDLMTPLVIRRLQNGWRSLETERTVSLSHCTKLTLLPVAALSAIYNDAADLPVTFVGLPTSDLYMMATPEESKSKSMSRVRGTLQVLEMIQSWGLNAVIAINNVGNAFTPQSNSDPLNIASLGVGVYQAGTIQDTELLYEMVSSRARAAIGDTDGLQEIKKGQSADLVLFGSTGAFATYRSRNISEIIYNPDWARETILRGRLAASRGAYR